MSRKFEVSNGASRPTNEVMMFATVDEVTKFFEGIGKVKDFERFKSKGASPDSAAGTCIGRWTGGRNGPYKCDWAAFGLFRGPGIVKIDNKEIPVFNFAETDGAGN